MDQIKIGMFISKCRKDKKMTQSELAEKLGVTDKSISNWENGRNMPDLSLFKPLCDVLEISINDLISGEKISKDDYQYKFEENIINTIDYSNKIIVGKNKNINIIILAFGILISVIALCMFKSESSWGSIFSIIGTIISVIGFARLTKNNPYYKRVIMNFGFYILLIIIIFIIDFLGVINIHQAPRFSIYKITSEKSIYYDTPFYDTVRCNKDEKDEYYKILKNQKYDDQNIDKYCNYER